MLESLDDLADDLIDPHLGGLVPGIGGAVFEAEDHDRPGQRAADIAHAADAAAESRGDFGGLIGSQAEWGTINNRHRLTTIESLLMQVGGLLGLR